MSGSSGPDREIGKHRALHAVRVVAADVSIDELAMVAGIVALGSPRNAAADVRARAILRDLKELRLRVRARAPSAILDFKRWSREVAALAVDLPTYYQKDRRVVALLERVKREG